MTFIANSPFPVSVRNLESHVSQRSISRFVSIDVFRGLTMLLMIFVNDLWTIRDVPQWLGHVSSGVDGMGLADVVFPMFGFLSRPLWGIHKIGASPSWVAICLGISILTLMGVIWLVDIKKKQYWFSWIKPAGTSTLTCYLLPYIHYGLLGLSGIALPLMFRTGGVGMIKCAVYALLIIALTGFLEKVNLHLRV